METNEVTLLPMSSNGTIFSLQRIGNGSGWQKVEGGGAVLTGKIIRFNELLL